MAIRSRPSNDPSATATPRAATESPKPKTTTGAAPKAVATASAGWGATGAPPAGWKLTPQASAAPKSASQWTAGLGYADHHAPNDHDGDEKRYSATVSRQLPNGTLQTFSGESNLFTPARAPGLTAQYDTGICDLAYEQRTTNGNTTVMVGGAVGETNGSCKAVLTDIQNTLHTALGYKNLRQSPASTGAEVFAEGRAKVQTDLVKVGDERLGASAGPDASLRANTVYATGSVGVHAEAHAGPVSVHVAAHGDLTPYDRRNREYGPQELNAGVEAGVDVELGRAVTLSVRAEKLEHSTMPGHDESRPEVSLGLKVKF
jgi:hypothetical protein